MVHHVINVLHHILKNGCTYFACLLHTSFTPEHAPERAPRGSRSQRRLKLTLVLRAVSQHKTDG